MEGSAALSDLDLATRTAAGDADAFAALYERYFDRLFDFVLRTVRDRDIAADVVQAGPGDLCVMVRSREAALAMRDEKFVPIDLALIGIVDELEVKPDGEFSYTLKVGVNRFT